MSEMETNKEKVVLIKNPKFASPPKKKCVKIVFIFDLRKYVFHDKIMLVSFHLYVSLEAIFAPYNRIVTLMKQFSSLPSNIVYRG